MAISVAMTRSVGRRDISFFARRYRAASRKRALFRSSLIVGLGYHATWVFRGAATLFSVVLSLGLGGLGASGCGLADFQTTVSDEASIPGASDPPSPLGWTGFTGSFASLNLSADKSFTNAGVKPSDVNSILVKSVHLAGADPGKDDLGAILESVTLSVEAPGLAKTSFATISPLPSGYQADMTVDGSLNLKPYATAPTMTISAAMTLKQRPALQTTLETTITLVIDPHL